MSERRGGFLATEGCKGFEALFAPSAHLPGRAGMRRCAAACCAIVGLSSGGGMGGRQASKVIDAMHCAELLWVGIYEFLL